MDMIGYAGTERKELEYQYWWGPKFSNDLESIDFGITRQENENYDKVYYNICLTEFGWYVQDEKRTFECEEITDIPNLEIESDSYYGCRYAHSILNRDTGLTCHLDGAIRAYNDENMINRLDVSLAKAGRDTCYTKLWRIDNDIPIYLWKELVSHYYRDNMLIGEYLGG